MSGGENYRRLKLITPAPALLVVLIHVAICSVESGFPLYLIAFFTEVIAYLCHPCFYIRFPRRGSFLCFYFVDRYALLVICFRNALCICLIAGKTGHRQYPIRD